MAVDLCMATCISLWETAKIAQENRDRSNDAIVIFRSEEKSHGHINQ